MISKYLNNLKKISLTHILLFFVVIFLFVIANLLFSINNSLAYISLNTSNSASNSYAILLEISNKNNTNWSKDKLHVVENRLKSLYELAKH